MPTFTRARLSPSAEQQADERSGEQELRLGREAGAVAASAAVEELLASGPQQRHEVLEVGRRRGCAAEHGRVEGPAPGGEQREHGKAASDLEPAVVDVLVRHPVACDVQRRTEEQRQRTRADERAREAPGRDMERDDHGSG